MLPTLSISALLILAARASICGATNLTAEFASGLSLGAEIFLPNDPNAANKTTQRYTTWAEPTFLGTIKPATEGDVKYIVKTAVSCGIPFYATGGGHGIGLGFKNVKNAVNIDLSNFKTVQVDAANNKLTVGGATLFADVYTPLYNAGKEIQTGNAPCVNFVGATIGAGVGPLQGLHGLVADALLSVRLVTATGELITVSQTSHPNLFWAIRGAGANFGIITSATYKIFDATNGGQVLNADFSFAGSANASLYNLVKSWDNSFPKEAGLVVGAGYSPATGLGAINVNFVFFGTQQAAQPYIDQLVALNPSMWRNLSVPWPQLATTAGFGNAAKSACGAKRTYISDFSIGVNTTDQSTYTSYFNDLVEFSKANPWYRGSFVLQRYGTQGPLAVPQNERGVYPWREVKTQILIQSIYPNSTYDSTVDGFLIPQRDAFQAKSGFPSLEVYLNYGHGDEGPAVWFGAANLPKLIALKKLWDPKNRFGAANPIPLTL